MATLHQSLGPDRLAAALAQGAELSVEDAVALASRGRGQRTRASSGWSSLTEAEKRMASLATEGLTNPEIAERLFVSLGTVKSHLSHIFAKLGVSGRVELASEVRRQDQTGEGS